MVVIVGGGITGLATAWFLHRQGREVRLLEADARPGGVIESEAGDGFLVERGPNSTLQKPGTADLIGVDHQAARQDVQAALDYAHVGVEHRMSDALSLKQRNGKGDEDGVIGTQQFLHGTLPVVRRPPPSGPILYQ